MDFNENKHTVINTCINSIRRDHNKKQFM